MAAAGAGNAAAVEWHLRPQNPKNPIVFFDITIGNIPAGRIRMELFADIAPKTAENFRHAILHRRVQTQEFLVLGRQLLTELKDNIYCLTDEVMRKAGQYNPSGYFLIEDVFCNDLRDPAAVDYSKPILDWLRYSGDEALKKWKCIASGNLQEKQKKMLGDARAEKVPSFKSFEMQTTRFCDLRFQLGAGYLYCHQGDCRHRIVIRDMRLIHPEEVSTRTLYPLVTYQLKLHPRKCYVCNICRATKVTVDDKLAKDNPSYFCDKCYFLLHYSDDHSLLFDDFSVFDYVHD